MNTLVKVNQKNNIISTFMLHQELLHMLCWTQWVQTTVVLLWPPGPAWPGPASRPNLSSHHTCSQCSRPQPRLPFVTAGTGSRQLLHLPTESSPTSTLPPGFLFLILSVSPQGGRIRNVPDQARFRHHVTSQITVVMLWSGQRPVSRRCPHLHAPQGRDISVLVTLCSQLPAHGLTHSRLREKTDELMTWKSDSLNC